MPVPCIVRNKKFQWNRIKELDIKAWFLQWILNLWLFNVILNLSKLLKLTILAGRSFQALTTLYNTAHIYKRCIRAVEAVSCSVKKKFHVKPLFHIQIYKKSIYTPLVKSNKYINTHFPTNLCIFDSLRSLLEFNFFLYVVYLGTHAVKKCIHMKKTII